MKFDRETRIQLTSGVVFGLAAFFLQTYADPINRSIQKWQDEKKLSDCVSRIAGTLTPPREERIAAVLAFRYPQASAQTIKELALDHFEVDRQKWDLAQAGCNAVTLRRGLV